MPRETLPISDIILSDRQRTDLGDIASLAESIKRFGLIQPIVLNQSNILVAGGRRLAAIKTLGWERVDITRRETLTQDELHELELEENIRRKSMHWTEEVLGIAHIHRLKRARGATEGWEWGQRQTADMFGLSVGAINYTLKVASELRKELLLDEPKRRCHRCDSAADAYRSVILKDEQDRITAELASRQRKATSSGVQEAQARQLIVEVEALTKAPDLLADARLRYESNPLNTIPFEVYWQEKTTLAKQVNQTVYLSNRLIFGDSIDFMSANPSAFDHIITDIPYGIPMDNIEQQNMGTDMSTVREAHDVDENLTLMQRYFPAAFFCTKPSAFVVTFCDQSNWQFMYELAIDAGFCVQRWPFVWVKTSSCQNGAAQYNFTKNIEIAMVCRKPAACLARPTSVCYVADSNEKAKADTGHPFAKPYQVTRFLTEAISIEGQTILDPFCGRGSMVLEMLRLNRHAYGVEKDTAHYNALMENVKGYYRAINKDYIFK